MLIFEMFRWCECCSSSCCNCCEGFLRLFWNNLRHEDALSCGSFWLLSRGWLSFLSVLIFAGPVIAAGSAAVALTAAMYVSSTFPTVIICNTLVRYLAVYFVLVVPVLFLCGSRVKCFPKFFKSCEFCGLYGGGSVAAVLLCAMNVTP